jgi:hypothetical protein
MSMFGCPPKGLTVPGSGLTDGQEQLDAPPVTPMGRMEQRGGVMGGRVDLGMLD